VLARTFTAETVETFDHDFGSAGEGKLMPHGVYDMVNQHAHLHLNASHDTSELCCDSVALWWEQAGRAAHPQAQRLLVLGDGGGSNSATQYLFKEALQGLAKSVGARDSCGPLTRRTVPSTIRSNMGVPHINAPARGDLSYDRHCAQCIARTKTTTGLRVTYGSWTRLRTGRKYTAGQTQHENRL